MDVKKLNIQVIFLKRDAASYCWPSDQIVLFLKILKQYTRFWGVARHKQGDFNLFSHVSLHCIVVVSCFQNLALSGVEIFLDPHYWMIPQHQQLILHFSSKMTLTWWCIADVQPTICTFKPRSCKMQNSKVYAILLHTKANCQIYKVKTQDRQ